LTQFKPFVLESDKRSLRRKQRLEKTESMKETKPVVRRSARIARNKKLTIPKSPNFVRRRSKKKSIKKESVKTINVENDKENEMFSSFKTLKGGSFASSPFQNTSSKRRLTLTQFKPFNLLSEKRIERRRSIFGEENNSNTKSFKMTSKSNALQPKDINQMI
jgi:hypothetical protein